LGNHRHSHNGQQGELESARAALQQATSELAHLRGELKKVSGVAEDERKRGDNLQRELIAREAEVERLKLERPHVGVVKMLEEAHAEIERMNHENWPMRYAAAMARVDELEKVVPAQTRRVKVDDERPSYTVKLRIGDKSQIERCPLCEQPTPESPRCCSFTLHVGYYNDGRIAEWFIRPDREKRTDLVASLADGWATSSSYAIQNGGDVDWITDKARNVRDESAGVPLVWERASNKYIPHPAMHRVSSVLDYAARVIDRIKSGKPATRLTDEEAAEAARKTGAHAD